jgi:hypothetical protein
MAAGRQRELPLYAGVALVITTGLSVLGLAGGAGLEGVAAAALIGQLMYAAVLLRLIVKEAGMLNPERVVLNTLVPLVWCAVAVGATGRLLPDHTVRSALLGLGAYLLLLTPLAAGWTREWRRLGH